MRAMNVCGNCGRTRRQGDAFCTGCGSRFADDPQSARPDSPSGASEPPGPADFPGPAGPYGPTETHGPAGSYGPADPYGPAGRWAPAEGYGPAAPDRLSGPSGPSHRPRRSETGVARLTFRPAVVATAVVLLAAAAAASGALLYVQHHKSHAEAAGNPTQSARTSSPAQSASPAAQGSSVSAPSPSSTSPSSSGGSAVTVAAGASQSPDASAVAAFLGQYFAAINARDYQSYLSLLSPQVQQGMTQAQFENGYRSTADSNETLVGISTASDGDLAAEVTFTSHQNPADSPDHSESCTNWDITLFLAQGGSGYLIDPAPSGYQASHQACS